MSGRREDWASRLTRYLDANRETPFVWGAFDCCLATCDAIVAMTGVDPAACLRGKYNDEEGALAAIVQEYGALTIPEMVEAVCQEQGFLEVSPLSAQRGDVVLVRLPLTDQEAVGILAPGGAIAIAAEPKGFVLVPIARALRAWRV